MTKHELKNVVVKHHVSYSQHIFYPVNDTAKLLFKLLKADRKGFTTEQIDIIKKLGFNVEIQAMVE